MSFSHISVPGNQALAELEKRRALFPSTGEYPFLIGDQEELGRLEENFELSEDVETNEILRLSTELDVVSWMARQREDAEEYEFDPDETQGDWPGEAMEKGSILLHTDIVSGRLHPTVYLGLAKIESPWQLAAVVKFGGWNATPFPQVHCGFHRRWQERYGTEITGISGDVIECLVRRPPTTQQAAMDLAWEQYWYCTDIVEQGCGTVSNLAATLINSPYWYFWWD